ncbi:MAG: viperin family antiviral radical SAM protein [Myxococcota bacterium]|nr:viperin family antiviral radical SAM protein [Myxococcota bacterium]
MPTIPISVNFHIWKPCNDRCRFCFATFEDVRGYLSPDDAVQILCLLRQAGCKKVNFAGGEPTLYPHLGRVLREARCLGFVTSIITNGARLLQILETHAADLDWVGLSVDSAREDVQRALGRGRGDHVQRAITLFDKTHALGLRAKLNTVVTALNWQEDMSGFVRRVRPDRWKVFQVLPIEGQNDGRAEPLLITTEQFRAFVERHEVLRAEGLAPVTEDNNAMRDSYVMIDPWGRFFGNATGRYVYSDPILTVGVETALAQVGWNPEKFIERGGFYDWSPQGMQPPVRLRRRSSVQRR